MIFNVRKLFFVIAFLFLTKFLFFNTWAIPLYVMAFVYILGGIARYFGKSERAWIIYLYVWGAAVLFVILPRFSYVMRQSLPYTFQAFYERGLASDLDVGKAIKPDLDPTVKKEIFDHVTGSRLAWDKEQLKKLHQIDQEYKTGKITIEEKEIEESRVYRKLIERHSELGGKLNLVNEPREISPPPQLTTPIPITLPTVQQEESPPTKDKKEERPNQETETLKPSNQMPVQEAPKVTAPRVTEIDLYGIEKDFGFFPVKAGDEIEIRSEGEICLVNSYGKRICSGPDGIDSRPFPAYPPIRLSNKGNFIALVGKYGESGQIFSVGGDFKKIAEETTSFHLYLNISPGVRNIFQISGKFHTVIRIAPR